MEYFERMKAVWRAESGHRRSLLVPGLVEQTLSNWTTV